MVRQAARDVLTLPESDALDAAEFIKDSGSYLVEALFGVEVTETRKELAHLMKRARGLKRLTRGFNL